MVKRAGHQVRRQRSVPCFPKTITPGSFSTEYLGDFWTGLPWSEKCWAKQLCALTGSLSCSYLQACCYWCHGHFILSIGKRTLRMSPASHCSSDSAKLPCLCLPAQTHASKKEITTLCWLMSKILQKDKKPPITSSILRTPQSLLNTGRQPFGHLFRVVLVVILLTSYQLRAEYLAVRESLVIHYSQVVPDQ